MIPDHTHETAERLTYHMMGGNRFEGIHEARRYMGECWERGDAMIPNCIKPGDVELDFGIHYTGDGQVLRE